MNIGEATLERGNQGVYHYDVWFRVTFLEEYTEVQSWNAGEEWSPGAIEGDFVEAEELDREEDASDDEIEYVRFRVVREEQTIIEDDFTSETGSNRSDFDTARIKTILRQNGIEPDQVKDIEGSVTESTVFLSA